MKGFCPMSKEYSLKSRKSTVFPIIGNADFGHGGIFMPMPEGLSTEIDSEQLSIELVEPVVRWDH